MKIKFSKHILILMAAILLSVSLVAAIFVFMTGDKTISNGSTADFTCTVDPMLGPATYEVKLIGNGVDKVLASGTNSQSVFTVPVTVRPADYGNAGNYTVQCFAKESTCDPCCCDNDTKSAKLRVCPSDKIFCDGDIVKKTISDPTQNCAQTTTTIENCNDKDGWYDTGNTKFVADQACSEKEQKEQAYRNYVCNTGACTFTVDSTRWTDTGIVNYKPSTTICRASAGACDKDEKCTGTSATCPTDTKQPNTLVCRASGGICDIEEKCTGVANDCPTNTFRPNSYICRANASQCDATEFCTGSTATCPSDIFKIDGTTCNDGLYCTNPDTCKTGICQGLPRDCSGDNILSIATCDNNPDNYHYTWDFRNAFTSICDEVNNKCTTGNDIITHTCDKARCSAECATNTDCNDGNAYTTDVCLSNCLCKHDNLAYCGDGSITTGETCELPNTNNNAYCSQTTTGACSGTKQGTRDAFGNCNSACGCTQDTFNYQCTKGQCGATCAANTDCNDNNANTIDTCDINTCACKHTTTAYCGDGSITTGETCELPNTNNNAYCTQTTTQCSGTKQGTRDTLGNCNSACGCAFDSFNYQCIKGQCGAACDSNDDCDDGNTYTTDTCLNNCTCKHDTLLYCGDGIIQAGEECESVGQYAGWGEYNKEYTCNENNTYKHCVACKYEQVNECKYYCSASSACDGKAPLSNLESCTAFGYSYLQDYCDANCHIKDDNCESSYLGCTADTKCDEAIPYTNDCNYMCEYKPESTCGNNMIDAGEMCEYPNTYENNYCSQTATGTCNGTKLGTRDAFGNCDSACGCTQDTFNYQCIKGQCGATCAANTDCNDNNANTIDTCLDECTCKHVTQSSCGDGIINATQGEVCELPNTQNNLNCLQSDCEYLNNIGTLGEISIMNGDGCDVCQGTKLGTRDHYGDCNAFCGCIQDDYVYACSIGKCGASCQTNLDCFDNNANTTDTCDTTTCACTHTAIASTTSTNYCGDKKCNSRETCRTCATDCGTCKKSSGGGGGGSSGSKTTTSDWNCGNWTTCINGVQTRTCIQGSISTKNTQNCTVITSTQPVIVESASTTNAPLVSTASTPEETPEEEEPKPKTSIEFAKETYGETELGSYNNYNMVGSESGDSTNEITGFASGIGSWASNNWITLVLIVSLILICVLSLRYLH